VAIVSGDGCVSFSVADIESGLCIIPAQVDDIPGQVFVCVNDYLHGL